MRRFSVKGIHMTKWEHQGGFDVYKKKDSGGGGWFVAIAILIFLIAIFSH